MVTNSEYEKIIQNFSKVPCTDEILETLKAKYSSDVSSNRALERCRSIFDLIKLLEKRDVFSVDNIKTLQEIAGILNRTDILNIIDEQSSWKPNIQGSLQEPDNVCERIFYVIGRDIGYKWKDFARGLKFREGDIDNLESKYRDVPERVQNILRNYKRDCPPNYFRTNLVRALSDARRKDLSNEIEDIMNDFKVSI